MANENISNFSKNLSTGSLDPTDNVEISVVIPIYNEESNIRILWEKLKSVLENLKKSFEVLFICDGSTDSSFDILLELAGKEPRLKVIRFTRNFGQTSAMSAGFDIARGNILIPMDGDLQNDPADIPQLLLKIDEGYDVVSGWRKERKDKALSRNIPSSIANKLISLLSGVHLHDYGCSLKAYRREVLSGVRLYGEMHRFIPIYASWHGARVTELPVTHYPRKFGRSNYGIERTIKVILDMIVVKFLFQYSQKPIYVFGGFGILSIVFGFLAGIGAIYLKLFRHISLIQTPLPLLSVMLFLIGFMSILMGLIAEIAIRTYYESQNKTTYLIKDTLNINKKNND